MNSLTYLSFEITDKCNLSHIHTKCPASNKNRYDTFKNNEKITGDDIVKFVKYSSDKRNFNNYVAFHYYNEPLLELTRILHLIVEIRKIKNDAKFSLWTNGLLISKDIGEKTDFLKQFNEIYITCYDEKDHSFFSKLVSYYADTHIRILTHNLDSRMSDIPFEVEYSDDRANHRCWKIHQEFVVDLYGNCHICCVDYNGTITIGNIKINDFDTIYNNWLIQKDKIAKMFQSKEHFNNSYDVCKKCYANNLFWQK